MKKLKKSQSTATSGMSNLRLRKHPKILTSPQQKESASTATRRVIPAPQVSLNSSPLRENDAPQDGEYSPLSQAYEQELELYASQNEEEFQASESEAEQSQKDDEMPESENDVFKHIRIITDACKTGPAVEEKWATIINQNWAGKKGKEEIKKLAEKYPSPENCELVVPKLNKELWQMLSSMQKRSDVKMAQIQRSLTSAVCASLSIANEILSSENMNRKSLIQKTADLITFLGHANTELCQKRKLFVRSVLKEEYKDLTTVSTEVTKNLFGDTCPNISKN